jgi:hypothetical protein
MAALGAVIERKGLFCAVGLRRPEELKQIRTGCSVMPTETLSELSQSAFMPWPQGERGVC